MNLKLVFYPLDIGVICCNLVTFIDDSWFLSELKLRLCWDGLITKSWDELEISLAENWVLNPLGVCLFVAIWSHLRWFLSYFWPQVSINWIFKVTFLHKTVFDRNWLFVVTLVIKIDDYDYNFNLILIQLSSVRILLEAKILTSHFGGFKLMQKQFLDSN